MSYRIELRNAVVSFEDGFGGTGAIDDASISAADTTILIDEDSLDLTNNGSDVVPVGGRFTTAGISTIRRITAQNANKVYTVVFTADGGTFTLTVNGQAIAAQAYNVSTAALQTAINGVVGANTVTVTGTAGNYTIEFSGDDVKNLSTPTLSVSADDLTNSATPVDAVVTVTHAGAKTWSITFTPAIVTGAVPADEDVITFLPQNIEMVRVGENDFNYTINKEYIYDKDRGRRDGVRQGDEQPMDVNTSFVYDWLRSSSGQAITPYEAANRVGAAAGWINAAEDECEPYCFNIRLTHTPPCGSSEREVTLFRRFRPNTQEFSVEDASVTMSGQCDQELPETFREAVA